MTLQHTNDPELQILAGIATSLEPRYASSQNEWSTSVFRWIKQQPSRTSGTIFEQLVSDWCVAKEIQVAPAPNSDSDRIIAGMRTEIKGSTLWQNRGFVFQQIRDQEYDIVICLGIRPHGAQCWVIPKHVVLADPLPEGVAPQHGGRAGRDTWWLRFKADNPPRWLRQWGGSLGEAHQVLRNLAIGLPTA